jgi:C1A family cysteine protease
MGNYLNSESEPREYRYDGGWKKDEIDPRDWEYLPTTLENPEKFSLKKEMPLVLDQGNLGSCTSCGIANALRFCEIKEKLPNIARSRLFIYYNERAMEGTINKDSGAQIRDGIKSVRKQGSCSEELWPYDISKFEDKPPQDCYKAAKRHIVIKYERAQQNLEHLKACLSSDCCPIVIGFVVYDSIRTVEVMKTGVIPLPKEEDKVIGGHCILLTGYDDEKKLFELENSWSTSWGEEGYGSIPYDYVTNVELASDFWVIQFVK